MGHDAIVDVEYDLRGAVPDSVPEPGGLFVRVHRRVQHLHVRVRGDQELLAVPVRRGQVPGVRVGRAVHHPDQRGHRERGGDLGAGREEAQVLRGAEGRPGARYRLKRGSSSSIITSRFKVLSNYDYFYQEQVSC